MSRIFAGALAIVGALFVTGCGILGLSIVGSGFVVEQRYGLEGFDTVDVGSGFNVDVQLGVGFGVSIRTDDNILPHVTVRQEGSRLVVGLAPGYAYLPTTLRAIVTLPGLARLDLSGGSVGYVAEGFHTTGVFGLSLSGGSSASVGPLECGDFDAELSGGSRLAGEIRCSRGQAVLTLSGGSEIGSLTGEAALMTLDQSGGGRTDLSGFTAQDAVVTLSGGSRARVSVTATLGVELSGGSSLEYRGFDGAPAIVGLVITGGSEITVY